MKKKLTDKFLQNLRGTKEGRLEIFDTLVPGFGVRIGTSARPSFFVMYRVHGKQFRETLGKYPVLKLGQAREQAITSLRLASGGADPKLEAIRKTKTQFKPIAQEFLERYAKVHQKPNTYLNTERHINSYLVPAWGHLPIEQVSRQHVVVLLDEIMDAGKGATANRVFATLSRLINWSIERAYLSASPIQGLRPPAKEVSRKRVLTLDEIRAIWQAAEGMGYPFGPWLKMLFASGGQREGDVSRMRWDEIRGTAWEIENPTKSDERHRVPLSSLAFELLDSVPRFMGPYVFSSRSGEVPISGYSKWKRKLDELSGVSEWRFHDVRRTVATLFGESLGKHPYVIERIQNRRSGTIKGVMAVYNRATYETEMADALSEWATLLRGLVNDDKVVAFYEQ